MKRAIRYLLSPLVLVALALPVSPFPGFALSGAMVWGLPVPALAGAAWAAALYVPSSPSSAPSKEAAVPAPDVRRAREDLAHMLDRAVPQEAIFARLREAGAAYDLELAVPTRYVQECRRGRALSTLLGLYRADHAYARAFGEEVHMPLRETLEQVELAPEARIGLAQAWDLERPGGRNAALDTRSRLQQAVRTIASVQDVRTAVDILYGTLLEQTHIVCSSLLRLPAGQRTQASIAPVLQGLIGRLDAFRRTLQGWASSPLLVREVGLHSDITLLDRVQADLEMLLLQPTPEQAQAALVKVQEEREDLVRLCKLPPKEEAGKFWQLQKREDLFKPRNFF